MGDPNASIPTPEPVWTSFSEILLIWHFILILPWCFCLAYIAFPWTHQKVHHCVLRVTNAEKLQPKSQQNKDRHICIKQRRGKTTKTKRGNDGNLWQQVMPPYLSCLGG
jgi:hypothetical protein